MSILDAARSAYAAGLCLLPTRNDGSKAPDVSSWSVFQTTRPTVEQMRAFDFGSRSGFGVIAGPVSQHRECWDFDCPYVYGRFVEAAAACGLGHVVGRVIAGFENVTPNGGRRWIVAYPETVEAHDVTLARRPGRDGEPAVKTLIELPTFAIVAPSNGRTHPTGRPYTQVSGGFDTIAIYTQPEREALLELARTFDLMPRRAATPVHLGSSKRPLGDRPGDDFGRRTTWVQILEPSGWTHVYDRDEASYWCRPGKSHGVSASTNIGGSDLFYPFTSSSLFEPDKSYTKFAVYALLEHHGDYRRAAMALHKRGYGETPRGKSSFTPTATAGTDAPVARTLQLTPASEITIRPVRWLWKDRIGLGTFSLLGGREGVGKTICAYTLAASITQGTLPGVFLGTPRGVIVAAAEDSWEHTIVPRLMAAGADLTRVYRVEVVTEGGTETTLSLPQDLVALEQVVRDVGASLIILDPLLSRLDSALDTHKDAEVRLALEPLVALAGATETCVFGLIHVNKSSSSDVLTLLMGSRAFAAVARSVLFVMVDPEDEGRRLLGQPKNNLGDSTNLATLSFRIVGALVATTLEGEVWTGKLEWLGESDRSIREAVDAATESAGDRSATSEAADWLQDYLTSQGGTAASEAIIREGGRAGHSRPALHRARQRLHVRCDGRGFPRKTYWLLPSSHSRVTRALTTGTTGTTETADAGDTAKDHIPNHQSNQSAQLPQAPLHQETTASPDDILPPGLRELTEPDSTDPIGAHDEED